MYLAPACTFWLIIGSLILEFRPMLESGAFLLMAERPAKFLAAAMMGFAVNSLAYIVIQVRVACARCAWGCSVRCV
jgi:anaerobic selenocysteine-containing dehydrogenase